MIRNIVHKMFYHGNIVRSLSGRHKIRRGELPQREISRLRRRQKDKIFSQVKF